MRTEDPTIRYPPPPQFRKPPYLIAPLQNAPLVLVSMPGIQGWPLHFATKRCLGDLASKRSQPMGVPLPEFSKACTSKVCISAQCLVLKKLGGPDQHLKAGLHRNSRQALDVQVHERYL